MGGLQRRRIRTGLAAGFYLCAVHGTPGEPSRNSADAGIEVPVGELDLSSMTCGQGEVRADRSSGNNPLRLRGRTFERGVGTRSPSEFAIDLKGGARRFRATVGVDDEVSTRGSVEFHIWVDGRKAATSGVMRGGRKPKELSVDLTGAHRMRLVVTDGGDDMEFDHADWADAVIELTPAAPGSSPCARHPAAAPPPPDPDPAIAGAATSATPALHGPRIVGAAPGHPFLFRIPATGERPLRFSVRGLPPDLNLNSATGLISGTLETTGAYVLTMTAENADGAASRELEIVAGAGRLALTPPLGWNSWNVWGATVDDAKVRAAADALVHTGLADHGYSFVNIDDGWQGERGADGVLRPNAKFPDMKALADYVHSKGLKLGIYSSPGPRTCQSLPGSLGHEDLDARTWAGWGVDYLKYDWCSYGEIAGGNPSPDEMKRPFRAMRSALDAAGRDVVYSMCQYGMGDVWTWGAEPSVGGDLWRTTGDITDTWDSMSEIGFAQIDRAAFAGPGGWNDADMLVVGRLGWGGNLRPTRLTRHEQVTHMTIWALLPAPLILGCDLTQLDDFTLALIANDDVLEVNQDPLGKPARLIMREGDIEIWSRPLRDGATAVGLFNRSGEPRRETLEHYGLELSGAVGIRDLWARRSLGESETSVTLEIAPHGARLLKLRER